ncbi:MAG: hypothetical protein WBB67_07885 [bacterium]
MNLLILFIAVWDYSYRFTTDFVYDNNIFSYSDEYIDEFINSVGAYRFPFETYDDLVIGSNLQFYLRNKFFDQKTTTLDANVKTSHYVLNNQKDYLRLSFGLRQSFGKCAIKISYQIIPNYLIRYYKNPQGQSSDYIGCEVKYHSLTGKLSVKPKPYIRLELRYKRGWDNYIAEFDLYDAAYNHVNLGSEIGINEKLALWFGYGYKSLSNDSASIPTGMEPSPDGSYHQHILSSEINLEVKTLVPTRIKLGYTYGFKNFRTEFSADSMHFGRQDHSHKVSARVDLKMFTGLYLRTSFLWQWRNATSEISPSDIDRIKDYDKYKLGAGLSFYH